jgi:DNA anti-recombination protein RmuC
MASGNGGDSGLRAGASRLRKEGERLAARIDRDVRTLTKRTRAELETDVRKLESSLRGRATDAIRDIEKRSTRILGSVEKQVAKAAEDVLKRLHGATQSDVAALVRRVQELEARVAALEGLSDGESPSV